MRTFKNAHIKIIERGETYKPSFMMKEDFVLKITGHNQLQVIKDRTGIFTRNYMRKGE